MDASPNKNSRNQRIPGTSEAVDSLLLSGLLQAEESALNAPTVAFGVFERALHFNVQNFHKTIRSNGFGTGSGKVRRAVAGLQNPNDGLLDPVRFERQSKRVAQHHRGAQ